MRRDTGKEGRFGAYACFRTGGDSVSGAPWCRSSGRALRGDAKCGPRFESIGGTNRI